MAYIARNCSRPKKPAKKPAACCTGDCRQGRDCPRRTPADAETAYLIAACLVTLIAAIAGAVHLAAWMGWA